MAKVIKYVFLSAEINHGTEDAPELEQVFLEKSIPWNEINEGIAKQEAWNGEYTVEDDGEVDPAPADDDEYADMASAIREGVNGI